MFCLSTDCFEFFLRTSQMEKMEADRFSIGFKCDTLFWACRRKEWEQSNNTENPSSQHSCVQFFQPVMIIKAESSVNTTEWALAAEGAGYAVKLGTFVTQNFCNEGARKIIHEMFFLATWQQLTSFITFYISTITPSQNIFNFDFISMRVPRQLNPIGLNACSLTLSGPSSIEFPLYFVKYI